MSELPPLQKGRQTRQPRSRTIGKSFLLHGNYAGGCVLTGDPITGQRFQEAIIHPDSARVFTQTISFHHNIVAFGTALGAVSIVDVNNSRKIDRGWKPMRQQHGHAVTALLLLPVPFKVNVPGIIDGASISLISASLRGEIALHDIRTGINHGMYRITDEPVSLMVTYLDYDAETNVIVAGTCTGDIWIWRPDADSEPRRVESTKYDKGMWEKEQDIRLDETSGQVTPETDIFFLSDFKNHSVIVITGTSIRRHSIHEFNTTDFANANPAKYSCVAIDPDHPDAEKPRLFAVGDVYGTVSIYNARQSMSDGPTPPIYTVTPVSDIPVTCLAINSLVIITGSKDGTAKAFSTLNGTLLRTLCAPNSRRSRHRPPSHTFDPTQNPIIAISLPSKLKSEVRGAIAFKFGHVRYWNYAPDGVGIVLKSKKRRKIRTTAKEMRGFVDDEIERDVEEAKEDETKRKRWEKMNGGIEEEDIALQLAMMMSREEDERRREFHVDSGEDEEVIEEVDETVWVPGRKISFGGTSGSGSPSVRGDGGRLEDVAVFRRGKVPEGSESSRFEEDLEFAIRLSLAEQESRESSVTRDE
jgi:WD40 repeat protein